VNGPGEAGKTAAALAGGAAMAAIAGLLGAVAGAGIARSRRREGAGRGWHIPIRREHGRATREPGAYAGGGAREVEAREAETRTYPPAEGIPPGGGTNEPPYQH
jgi:hypothetical protein